MTVSWVNTQVASNAEVLFLQAPSPGHQKHPGIARQSVQFVAGHSQTAFGSPMRGNTVKPPLEEFVELLVPLCVVLVEFEWEELLDSCDCDRINSSHSVAFMQIPIFEVVSMQNTHSSGAVRQE